MIPNLKLVGRSFLRYATRWNRTLSPLRLFSTHISEEEASFGSYSVILPGEPFTWGVSHITPRTVPHTIARPHYARVHVSEDDTHCHDLHETTSGRPHTRSQRTPGEDADVHDDGLIRFGGEEETKLRAAAKLARKVREFSGTLVQPGVTTNAIDTAIHNFIVAHGAYPSPLLYSGFPRSCCTSINNVVTHGIPDDRPLEDGDIINIDITVYLGGYHGDTSRTFLVGNVDQPGRDLVSMTNAALEVGIRMCGPGQPFNAIGHAIHELVRNTPYSVCSAFSGHGIGKAFHRPPWIYHTLNEEPGVMRPGDCFTIEPCIIQGSNPQVWIFPDGWTASTENCARSAQAEDMVLITETSAEVLTL